jgi:radical SAM protein with 4Fe4S-binding SPASM domain
MGMVDYEGIVTEYKEAGGKIINFTPYAGEVFTDREFLTKVGVASDLGFDEINTYSNVTLIDKFGINNVLNSGLTSIAISTSPLNEEMYEKIFQSHLYKKMLKNLVDLLKGFHESESKTIKSILVSFRSDRALSEIMKMDDYKLIEPYINGGVRVDCLQTFDSWMGMIKQEDLVPGMILKDTVFEKPLPCDRLYMLKVTSNGKIRACGCRYDHSKETDDFYIGHTNEMSLEKAYNSEKLNDIKQSFRDGNPPDECKSCSWYESFRYEGK